MGNVDFGVKKSNDTNILWFGWDDNHFLRCETSMTSRAFKTAPDPIIVGPDVDNFHALPAEWAWVFDALFHTVPFRIFSHA